MFIVSVRRAIGESLAGRFNRRNRQTAFRNKTLIRST